MGSGNCGAFEKIVFKSKYSYCNRGSFSSAVLRCILLLYPCSKCGSGSVEVINSNKTMQPTCNALSGCVHLAALE